MNTATRLFIRQHLGVVLTTLMPVILITFMSLTLEEPHAPAPVAQVPVTQSAS